MTETTFYLLLIIGSAIFALCAAFFAVTETMKRYNDRGDSSGDRFYYIQDFKITRELDNVPPDFDDRGLGRPYDP